MRQEHLRDALQGLARLLIYPTEHPSAQAEQLYVLLVHDVPMAAKAVADFGERSETLSLEELQEIYTHTFEIQARCALEIGWHLFGEEFTRGLLLVRLRGELAAHGIRESAELPDHLTHVLALVAAMAPEEADRFVPACVIPAVRKMSEATDRSASPWAHVLAALRALLEHQWGHLVEDEAPVAGRMDASSCIPEGVDPLRVLPVLDDGPPPCGEQLWRPPRTAPGPPPRRDALAPATTHDPSRMTDPRP